MIKWLIFVISWIVIFPEASVVVQAADCWHKHRPSKGPFLPIVDGANASPHRRWTAPQALPTNEIQTLEQSQRFQLDHIPTEPNWIKEPTIFSKCLEGGYPCKNRCLDDAKMLPCCVQVPKQSRARKNAKNNTHRLCHTVEHSQILKKCNASSCLKQSGWATTAQLEDLLPRVPHRNISAAL